MNNFTANTYDMKREIMNFCKKISKRVNKPITKFIKDIEYGIAASGSCLISNISRNLNENIKLKNTIERLCDNLNNFMIQIKYIKIILKLLAMYMEMIQLLYLMILIYLKYMEKNLRI